MCQVSLLSIFPTYCVSYNLYNGPERFTNIIPIFQIKKLKLRAFKSLTKLINEEAMIQTQVCLCC